MDRSPVEMGQETAVVAAQVHARRSENGLYVGNGRRRVGRPAREDVDGQVLELRIGVEGGVGFSEQEYPRRSRDLAGERVTYLAQNVETLPREGFPEGGQEQPSVTQAGYRDPMEVRENVPTDGVTRLHEMNSDEW